MFNPDFYPTPPEVAATMLDPLDLRGRVVVEPSAGSGNLVQACLERGAAEVLMVEPEPKLRAILAGIPADCRLIGNDWLAVTADQISHADLIVMNPPFSADERHILHAWQVAPPGCEIVSLCNWATIDGYRSTKAQQEVCTLIEQYGDKENLGPVFGHAERTTRVEIGLLRLAKPGQRVSGADEFDGFFLGPDDIEAQGHGLIRYRRSRELVNRYVEACRVFDEQLTLGVQLQAAVGEICKSELALQVTMEGCPATRNRFRKEIQKAFWKSVLDEMLPQAMATSQLAGDINRFVEQQTKVPFTERNIYRMLQIIAGTQEQRIDRAVEEVFDNLTKHTKENRWNVEGWATNEAYLFGQKFIIPYLAELDWGGRGVRVNGYGRAFDSIRDLIKALCHVTGRAYAEVQDPAGGFTQLMPGEWLDWGFFEFKVYRKGTGHFRFKSLEDWAALNARVARIKGLTLPEKLRRKSTSSRVAA
jgi:predicted RNA methylase